VACDIGGATTGGRHYWKPASDYGITCIYRPTIRAEVEDHLAQIIGVVKLPSDWEPEILARLSHRLGPQQDIGTQRARLESQLERARKLFYLGDWTESEFGIERARSHHELETLRPVEQVDVTRAGELLRDFGGFYRNGSLENRKGLLQSMLEKVFLEVDEICAITPQREPYPLIMFAYGGGSDGHPVSDRLPQIHLPCQSAPITIVEPATPPARLDEQIRHESPTAEE